MAELVVKVPEKLKERMSKISWIDWSSVVAKAISERLEDIEELEMRRKVAEISEIAGVELKIKIPERVKQEFPEVEWSKIAERAVLEEFRKLASIKLFDELFKHSELTDEDCLKLGREVSRAVRLRIEKEL